MFLLDTNIVSELRKTRPHGGVVAWLQSIEGFSTIGDSCLQPFFQDYVSLGFKRLDNVHHLIV